MWVKIFRDFSKIKNIDIFLDVKSNSIYAEVDIRKFEQVFNNLVTNAIKFSFPGSTISIILEETENRYAVLRVRDTGTGIAPNDIEKIFKPFIKVAAEGTAGEKCTGLGLSIVKKIVEGHNGTIEVESSPGKGSEFIVKVPLE